MNPLTEVKRIRIRLPTDCSLRISDERATLFLTELGALLDPGLSKIAHSTSE